MTDTPEPTEPPGEELMRLIDELTPVLYYGQPVSDAQWRKDKAKYLKELNGPTDDEPTA